MKEKALVFETVCPICGLKGYFTINNEVEEKDVLKVINRTLCRKWHDCSVKSLTDQRE